ncbi:MAG: hypothetical protein ACPGUV_01290 [Polyangiales bacterium]
MAGKIAAQGRSSMVLRLVRARFLLFSVALCLSAPLVASAAPAHGFSAAERAALARGRLVAHQVAEKRGALRLLGGSSWQVVRRHPDALWQALLQTSGYRHMLPGVRRAVLLQHAGNERIIQLEQRFGRLHLRYRLQLRIDPAARQILFRLDPEAAAGMRAGWGFLRVRPYGPAHALLSYGVRADVGPSLWSTMLSPVVQDWLLRVPSTIKRHLERCRRAQLSHHQR